MNPCIKYAFTLNFHLFVDNLSLPFNHFQSSSLSLVFILTLVSVQVSILLEYFSSHIQEFIFFFNYGKFLAIISKSNSFTLAFITLRTLSRSSHSVFRISYSFFYLVSFLLFGSFLLFLNILCLNIRFQKISSDSSLLYYFYFQLHLICYFTSNPV